MAIIQVVGFEYHFPQGTVITIQIPRTDPPLWFANHVDLINKKFLISLDDDPSIHQIWINRFKILGLDNIVLKQFQSGEAFKKYFNNNVEEMQDSLFLIDYELLDQNENGLDIISKLNIFNNSILVTSRYEEESLQVEAVSLNLKILPKSLAGFIPLLLNNTKKTYDLILLDNDDLVRMTWEMKAKSKGKNILLVKSYSELKAKLGHLDPENLFYIDVHLSEDENGIDISKELFELGFSNIYLATGYDPNELLHVTWIKGVVGKTLKIWD